jgi:hypothetical protein
MCRSKFSRDCMSCTTVPGLRLKTAKSSGFACSATCIFPACDSLAILYCVRTTSHHYPRYCPSATFPDGGTHISLNSFQRTLKSSPCRPLVKSRVGNPLPNSAKIPSAATISFAAVPERVSSKMRRSFRWLTVSDVLLVNLSIGLDDSKTVADSVGNYRCRKADERLSLIRVSH